MQQSATAPRAGYEAHNLYALSVSTEQPDSGPGPAYCCRDLLAQILSAPVSDHSKLVISSELEQHRHSLNAEYEHRLGVTAAGDQADESAQPRRFSSPAAFGGSAETNGQYSAADNYYGSRYNGDAAQRLNQAEICKYQRYADQLATTAIEEAKRNAALSLLSVRRFAAITTQHLVIDGLSLYFTASTTRLRTGD